MPDKKQNGRRTTVRKSGGVEHMRTGLEGSTSFSRMTHSHTAYVRRKPPEILHTNLKYHPYKMQVVQRLSDTDKIIA